MTLLEWRSDKDERRLLREAIDEVQAIERAVAGCQLTALRVPSPPPAPMQMMRC